MSNESEYGKGLVICLVKFAGHFDTVIMQRIKHVVQWHDDFDSDDSKLTEYGQDFQQDVAIFKNVELATCDNYEQAIASLTEMWANGASDHLYEIQVPKQWKKTKIARKVKELQTLGLEMGHGFAGKLWTFDDIVRLKTLAREIALLIDKKLGINDAQEGGWS